MERSVSFVGRRMAWPYRSIAAAICVQSGHRFVPRVEKRGAFPTGNKEKETLSLNIFLYVSSDYPLFDKSVIIGKKQEPFFYPTVNINKIRTKKDLFLPFRIKPTIGFFVKYPDINM